MLKKPNIVVFMTDQQNAQTIKPDHVAITPNIDKFYDRSLVFDKAFCPAPHCCPARATFFSGLYPSQHGIWHNVEVDNAISRGLLDGVTLFPELLSAHGYRTVFSGKWHVSGYEGPADRGFQEVLRECTTNNGRTKAQNIQYCRDWEKVYNHKEKIDLVGVKKNFGQISRVGYPIYHQFGEDPNPFGDATTVEVACEHIRARAAAKTNSNSVGQSHGATSATLNQSDVQEPFFYYVGTIGPHDPYCPPQEFIDLYKDVELTLPASYADDLRDKPNLYRRTRDRFDLTKEEQIESMRRYLAFVSFEDSLFGKLMDTLTETGELENTYVLYLTDHGDYLGAHGLWAKGLPCFKEAYNICAMVGGGDITNHCISDALVSLADFAPTILALAGVENKKIPPMVGRSLLPFIEAAEKKTQAVAQGKVAQKAKTAPSYLPTPEGWRTELFTQTNGNEIYGMQRAVWNHEWKYVLNLFDYDELYDLKNDPDEMHNLIEEKVYAPIVKEMCKKIWRFAKETRDNATCPYIMVSLAPYGPGIILEE